MSPAWIRPRVVKTSARNPRGKTYQVLYRRGGRNYPIETGGTFKTEREAKLRRDLIAGWLAAGLDPRAELDKATVPAAPKRTYAQVAAAYQASRVDASPETVKNTASHMARLLPLFDGKTPDEITVADCITAVASLTAALKPGSVKRYWTTNKLILDFAGADPNPARDPRVKLPTIVHEEPDPPTAAHLLALLDRIPVRWRLPLITLEQTAMAVGEAQTLAWGDVDVDAGRFRLRRSEVKANIRARARWIQVPGWLMDLIEATCPADDRTADRRVFQGFTADVAKNAMARACVAAGIPHFHPHDLRHRRLSLWHGQGVPARELAARAGHTRASMSLDVYSHVMPLDEASPEALSKVLVKPR